MTIDVVLDEQEIVAFKKALMAYTTRSFTIKSVSSVLIDAARYFYAIYRAYPDLIHELDESEVEALEELLERFDYPANRRPCGKRMFTVRNAGEILEQFALALETYASIERGHGMPSDQNFIDLVRVTLDPVRSIKKPAKSPEQWLNEWDGHIEPSREYVNIWAVPA